MKRIMFLPFRSTPGGALPMEALPLSFSLREARGTPPGPRAL